MAELGLAAVTAPRLIGAPERLWRIGRPERPFHTGAQQRLDQLPENQRSTVGGRWDDPQARFLTIYTGENRLACAYEYAAHFRPSRDQIEQKIIQATADEPPDAGMDPDLLGGVILEKDLAKRSLASATITPLPFIDIAATSTHTFLNRHDRARAALRRANHSEFDRGVVMHADRELTRAVAGLLRDYADEDLSGQVAGLSYESRLANHRCYAVWADRITFTDVQPWPLTADTPELQHATHELGITIIADTSLGPLPGISR